jgi:hypothetical protein
LILLLTLMGDRVEYLFKANGDDGAAGTIP